MSFLLLASVLSIINSNASQDVATNPAVCQGAGEYAAACAAVVNLEDRGACDAVMTGANTTVPACTYTPAGAEPPRYSAKDLIILALIAVVAITTLASTVVQQIMEKRMLKQEGQEGKSKLANTKSMALMVGASVAAAMLGEDGDAGGDHDEELGDHHDDHDHDDYADADGEGDRADALQAAQDAAPLVAATAVAGFSTARAARTVSNASDLLREPPPIAVGPLAMRAGKRSTTPRRVKTRLSRTPPPVPSTRSATPPRRAPPSRAVAQPPDPEPDPEPEAEPAPAPAPQPAPVQRGDDQDAGDIEEMYAGFVAQHPEQLSEEIAPLTAADWTPAEAVPPAQQAATPSTPPPTLTRASPTLKRASTAPTSPADVVLYSEEWCKCSRSLCIVFRGSKQRLHRRVEAG